MAAVQKVLDLALKHGLKSSAAYLVSQQQKLGIRLGVGSIVCSSQVRWYRGSNRDTRKREQNLRNKFDRIRNANRRMVFDQKAFMFNNFEKELFCFRKRLNLDFTNDDILKAAFVHPSFLERIKKDEDIPSFALQNMALVDELRNLIPSPDRQTLYGLTQTRMLIASNVFMSFPFLPSALIGKISNALTSRETITKLAEYLGIPELVIIDHDIEKIDKEKHVPFSRSDVICDAFYGLMGAILQDLGQEELAKFVDDFVMVFLDEEEFREQISIPCPEETASEIATLAGYQEKIEARLMFKAADETALPLYVVGIFSGGTQIGEGAESTLKKAELAAFENAVHSFMWVKQAAQTPLYASN